MRNSISICVTTYRRAGCLRQALASIVDADLRPIEVIVGDNGGEDAETAKVIAAFVSTLPIRYVLHNPPQNYGANLKAVLSLAQGDWVSVIHDDDFYLEGCGRIFRCALQESDFDFFFSDHLICSNNGVLLIDESKDNSNKYNRSLLIRGHVSNPLEAVLLSQVCMDGWFARRELVQSVQVDSRWPEYVDTQYLVQFALNSQKWFYEKESTFVYRLSAVGLTSSGIKVQELYEYYFNLYLEKEKYKMIRDRKLTEFAPVAVTRWLQIGETDKARECLQSRYYPVPKTIRGIIKYVLQSVWSFFPVIKKSNE